MQTFPFKSVTATALLSLCLHTNHYAQDLSTQCSSYSKAGEEELIAKTVFLTESTNKILALAPSAIRRFDAEKSKRINKVFKVSATDKLDIENSFGKIHINTWDKNEITVEVVMIARANSEEKAQEILDKLSVNMEEENTKGILFRTQLGKIKSSNFGGKKGFEVNYTVSMPRNNPLRLKNSFGDVYLANFSGSTDLDVGYGSLKTDELTGSNTMIKIAFGSGDLVSVKNGKLDVSYSKLILGSSESLELKSDFSEIKINRVQSLSIRNKYGNTRLGAVGNVQGSSSFAGFRIQELSDRLDMRIEHSGDFEVDKIGRNFKSINLDGSFSSFEMNFENNTAFNFDVDLDFGSFRLDKEQAQFSLAEKKSTSSHHIGKFGKSNGDANVKIRAQYGDVRFEREN